MAQELDSWFVHQVSELVTHLAQQRVVKTRGSMRVKEGVVGKSYPFNRLSKLSMQLVTTRDADTVYLNPTQGKVRADLRDYAAAVLIDDFDEVKTLANPRSEFSQMMAYARARKEDELSISIPIDGTGGGFLGIATVVDEAAETTSNGLLPAAQKIAAGAAGFTFTKINEALEKLNTADVDQEDRYLFVSPIGVRNLLNQTKVASADFATLKAIQEGGFPMDHSFMGFKWRMSTLLPKLANIRTCIAVQKNGVGAAYNSVKSIEIDKAVHKNNATQVLGKLSGGVVRVDDQCVVAIDIDESLPDPS